MVKTFVPATGPSDPGRVWEEGFLKVSLKGVSEGVVKGFGRGQPEDPSKPLQNASKNA